MKRFCLFVFAVASMLLAASCQQELNPVTDGDTTVTFTVNAGDVATRAIADGTNVDALHWEIYKTDDVETATTQPLGKDTIIDKDGNKEFTVELKLLADQKYTIIFWAEVDGADHYITTDLRNVAINDYSDEEANDETRAAFFRVYPFETENGETITETIELYRPFSQINLGSTTYETSFNKVNGGNVEVETSEMTVTKIATSFNTLTGKGEGEQVVTFKAHATPNAPADDTQKLLEVNDLYYYWLGMNYLIVCGDSDNVDVDITLDTNFGEVKHTISSVPVKENFRTNLLGNFLTTDATFTVVVDEDFEVPDIVIGENWTQTGNYQYMVNSGAPQGTLAEILAHADKAATEAATKADGPVVTIDLNGDVYWKTEGGIGSSPLLPAESLISKVIINGNNKTFTATGAGVGSIRLANGGLLEFNNVNIVDESVSYDESAWELRYLEFAGNLAFSECTFNSGVQFETQGDESVLSATFDRCRFITNEESVYAVWVCDGTTTFTGCKFEGTRGLKMHEDYGSVIASVTVDGCTFGPLSEKPGIAIGSIREPGTSYTSGGTYTKPADAAVTSVTIKNSFFFGCQPGDQNLYMYESDTDVTTFTFNLENNEVHADPSTMLIEWVSNAQAGDVIEVPAGEYTFPKSDCFKEGVTLKCAEGTVFTGQSSLDINGAIVEGATFENESGTAVRNTINGTFKNCEFTGSNATRYCYAGETVVFEDCVFDGAVYGMHFDGGANPVTFRRCQLSGFNAFGSALTDLTFENCVFKSTGKSGYNGANLWGKTTMTGCEFIFDGKASTEWIGLNAAGSGKEIVFTDCVVKDAEGNEGELTAYFANYSNGCKVTVDGVELILAKDAEGLAAAFAAKAENIILMPGTFEGTFKPAAAATVKSASSTEKAVIKGRVNIDGYAEGIVFENVKFEINDASKVKPSFTGAQYKYPGIVVMYATAATFEGCEFACEMASGVCGINYGAHAAGKILTVNNCKFTGDFYAIRTRTLFSITNNEFDVHTDQGKLCAVWTWGNGNNWADAVTFTGNKNVNANEIYGVQLSSTNFTYNNMTINVQNNTGFAALKDGLNTKCTYSDITFADGSETFEF